jgi:Right handed beta helix region
MWRIPRKSIVLAVVLASLATLFGIAGTYATSPASAATTGGTIYYLDSVSGSDSSSGTGPTMAWKTLDRATRATFSPGDRVLLRHGQNFVGSLTISESGAAGSPIVIGTYGVGTRPVITGGFHCVKISGSYVTVQGLNLQDCSWAGIEIAAGARFNTIVGSEMSRNIAGVLLSSGSTDNQVLSNLIHANTKMSRLTPEPYDDTGAFGVLVNGDSNEIAYNTISEHDTFSYDYGRDGAAVEIYGGQSNHIHHNYAVDNDTFSELGNSRSHSNSYGYNVVRSALPESTFLVTRGAQDGHGPIDGTHLYNNTAVMTGGQTQGFVCYGGCSPQILYLRNNIIEAVWKAGYADGPIDEDYNLFHRGITQFSRGAHTLVADPAFVSGATGNFALRSGSCAIDAGADSPYVRDFQGQPVPLDGNGDNRLMPDIGAFEFTHTSATTDDDNDTWSDVAEATIGTDPLDPCPDNASDAAWPPDINNDRVISFGDIGLMTSIFGQTVAPAPARRDIAPDSPDRLITFADIGRITARFGRSCVN